MKAVLSGQRCAVAIWYTLNPQHKEKAHEFVHTILDKLDKAHPLGPPHGGEL